MKKTNYTIALFMALLIVCLPVVIAEELNTNDLAAITGNAAEGYGDPDAADACIKKNEEGKSFIEVMDNGIVATLEKIFAIAYTLCYIASTIDTFIKAFQVFWGFNTDGSCVKSALVTAGGAAAPCSISDTWFGTWDNIYTFLFNNICCFTNCGWCTGDSGGSKSPGGNEKKCSLAGFNIGLTGSSLTKLVGIDGTVQSIGQYTVAGKTFKTGIGPYDNIYTAAACICPTAILFNLRKLKTIYQTYNCCVEQACKSGKSTEGCEKMLDEATCMYWTGSLGIMAVKILLHLITGYIINTLLGEKIKKLTAGYEVYGRYAWAILQIFRGIQNVMGLEGTFEWMQRSFSEPECSDLGFEELTEYDLMNSLTDEARAQTATPYQYRDTNKDGRWDAQVKEKTSPKKSESASGALAASEKPNPLVRVKTK